MDSSVSAARILVVEDDPILHDFIVELIRRSGHEAVSAHTGEEALAILRDPSGRIDWLLTDIRLPGHIDGWLVGSEFALSHPLKPVIYISGVAPDSTTRRASNSVFVPKPLNPTALLAIFKRLSKDGAANAD